MERPYTNDTEDDVIFFTGPEVENTPAKGLLTLFVVGVQPVGKILNFAKSHEVNHIYLGANQSYTDPDDEAWHTMTNQCLEQFDGYVTLDINQKFFEQIDYLDWVTGWCEKSNFIPMIAVKIPYIELFNYNTTIKLDDIGFNKTNPGVWCHSLHDLKPRDNFTHWGEYTKDKVVK